ncbi:GNAT family N-acetyltransferase [Egbenema bharatensis]|uniref:GNAT family N-acetyltransferase n=1 Tax=Egbenema bharatensis TaxID=3463334 RepID=UPI003A835914
MMTQSLVQVRIADLEEDLLLAEHFYQMWLDLEIPPDAIDPDWRTVICQFMIQARQNLNYRAFVAEVEEGSDRRVVGSVGCQLYAGLYPNILQPSYRQYGYIWGVYVEPAYRRQGIATQLTATAIDYLKSIHCTRAILNASPLGQPVYERLGFKESNVMQLELEHGAR